MLFQMNEHPVRKALQLGPQEPRPLGERAASTTEVEPSLAAMLRDAFHEDKAITLKDFLGAFEIGKRMTARLY
jgi:hypothetical protein